MRSRLERDFGRTVPVRLALLLCWVGALAQQACVASRNQEGTSRAPIDLVLLISIDTLRADHLGCYGYQRATSPTVDRLCDEGLVFLRARSHAPSTLLSHASMLTGIPPRRHGASHTHHRPLPDRTVTLAEVFRDAGWNTLALTGGGQLAPEFGLAQGFDVYETFSQDFDLNVDRFFELLDQRSSPTFAFLHTYEVHHPYEPPTELLRKFSPAPPPGTPDDVPIELLREFNWGGRELTAEGLDHIVAAYDAEILAMDGALGRLLEGLEERHRSPTTLVVFTSDHGEEFMERKWVGWHGATLYEEMLRVPLILRGPGVPRGTTVEHGVSQIDLAATVVELVGLAPPATLPGTPLWPFGPEERRTSPHTAMGEIAETPLFCSIVAGDWKWVEGELFHLGLDPIERDDLSSERPELVDKLRRLLGPCERSHLGNARVPSERTREQLEALGYID